ncbi:GNAT family N-acetyltransferase [Actinomadura atramentaria]|uniref:GNAT family N-acetyltransferase n=1 Tax=Actinomadura atramentaria TaxID=1990 RepID=UPI00037BF093|nr:GNAT family N-acetyltransferase [Actinomadura atramentaria]
MSTEIADAPDADRYEIRDDGVLAGFAQYRAEPGAVVFVHTEVFPEFEGKGIGGALARGALDDVRARGLKAVPSCPFIRGWIERHPDYRDLVA